jgi:ribose 5-phosphate isomerase A
VITGYGDGRVEVHDINKGEVDETRYDFLDDGNIFADLGD